MSKPFTPVTDILGDNYLIDAVLEEGGELPPIVLTHLRHLLVACELGDLVVIQCTNVITDQPAFVLCAHVLSADKRSKLLPICELEDLISVMSRMRPPSALPEIAFARATYTANYAVEIVQLDDGNKPMLAATGDDDNDSVH